MHMPTPEPVKRSDLRMKLGKRYFTLKRYILWIFGGIRFAKKRAVPCPYAYFTHETPLLRRLKGVDMQLQHNKVANLKLAAPRVEGITLLPGETFSYWKCIGSTTKQKGYLDGMILKNGSFVAGTGGGLCQLSNLIYWMTLHTPLTVTERHRHGYDVFPDASRTQPFGSGATCYYNYGDLMIRNDTNQVFTLHIEVGEHSLSGAWKTDKPPEFRYEVYEKAHEFRPEFWGGYTRHNMLCRRKYTRNGLLLDDEYIAENHAIMMYAPLIAQHSAQ